MEKFIRIQKKIWGSDGLSILTGSGLVGIGVLGLFKAPIDSPPAWISCAVALIGFIYVSHGTYEHLWWFPKRGIKEVK